MKPSQIIFFIWGILALAILLPVTILLHGTFPIFTVLWLLVPLIAVIISKDPGRVGFRAVSWSELVRVTALNLGALLLVMLLFEPWSHTYQKLIQAALSTQPPDTTFAWLLHFERPAALGGMFFFSGLVTLFGEELFFRGWLLQLLLKRWRRTWAVIFQAFLFMLPNFIAAFVLPPVQGILYALVYTFLGIGVIGGWAASRTQSIWPSLISASVANFLFVAWLV